MATFDIHTFLIGNQSDGSGSYVNERFRRRVVFRVIECFSKMKKIGQGGSLAFHWSERLAKFVEDSPLDYAVALGFDGVIDRVSGRLDYQKTPMYIPNSWVFKVCQRYSHLLPGVSINPYRKCAEQLVQKACADGAVLMKWLPSVQGIQLNDPQLKSFYQTVAKLKIPILVHIGPEITLPSIHPSFNQASDLRYALDLGVTFVLAHGGVNPISACWRKSQIPVIEKLCSEYSHIWLDNAALPNLSRFHQVNTFLKSSLFLSRTLHGSDYPIPTNAFYFPKKVGFSKIISLEKIKNPLSRDIEIKAALGFPKSCLSNASRVLINL